MKGISKRYESGNRKAIGLNQEIINEIMAFQTLNITFTPYKGHRDIKGNKGGSTPRT